MEFIWKRKTRNIKSSALCKDCDNGLNSGLNNVDVFPKIVNLQCPWIKRLFDNSFHQ